MNSKSICIYIYIYTHINIIIIIYLFYSKKMSKENIRKHTSIKTTLPGLQRKQSRQQLKQQMSDHKLTATSQQTEVMKKIQNKLRMRKRSTNVNQNQRNSGTPPDLSSNDNMSTQNLAEYGEKRLQAYDQSIDIPETVDHLLHHDDEIVEKITLTHTNREVAREQLIRDSTFILCQLNKGRRIQQVILERLNTIIEANKLKQRIEQKQKSIMAMMDDRIKRLMQLQKPLVH